MPQLYVSKLQPLSRSVWQTSIIMCPSCPDRSWGLQDLRVKQDLKADPIRVLLRNPLDRGISNQPLISLLTLQEQKASSKMVRLTLSSTCRRQSTVQLFRAFPWAQPRRQLLIITRKDPLRNKPTNLFMTVILKSPSPWGFPGIMHLETHFSFFEMGPMAGN